MKENKGQFRPWYGTLCHEEEVDRIFNVKTANDYLLKLRADSINLNTRLYRVYLKRILEFEKGKKGRWRLDESFSTYHFERFLDMIEDENKRKKCEKIAYGNVFSNDPNGFIMSTDYGPVMAVSDSLSYFLEFMNMTLLNLGTEIPTHVRRNCLRIALRIMEKTESMDFDLDPRGTIPKEIKVGNEILIENQLKFIAGHEFAHYLLGHLSEEDTSQRSLYFKTSEKDELIGPNIKVYNSSQEKEFQADLSSLSIPDYDVQEYSNVFRGALYLLIGFEIHEHFKEVVAPSSFGYKTHPSGLERIENILRNAEIPEKFDLEEFEGIKNMIATMKELVDEELAINYDIYEVYGSLYLDKPNSEWRGKELVDRVDY